MLVAHGRVEIDEGLVAAAGQVDRPRSFVPFGNRRDERGRRRSRELRFDERARLRDRAFGERNLLLDADQPVAVFGREEQRSP